MRQHKNIVGFLFLLLSLCIAFLFLRTTNELNNFKSTKKHRLDIADAGVTGYVMTILNTAKICKQI
jgi:hypothetical protein